jgi:hypothetical protein
MLNVMVAQYNTNPQYQTLVDPETHEYKVHTYLRGGGEEVHKPLSCSEQLYAPTLTQLPPATMAQDAV